MTIVVDNIAGKVQRIAELHEVLDEVIEDQKKLAAAKETKRDKQDDGRVQHIAFEGVDIVSPGGDSFASAVSFNVQPNQGLMVTGRSAVGKTSLVRVLSGLWPTVAGTVVRAGGSAGRPSHLSEMFIVPQGIHMVLGTLADQVTYPLKLSKSERTPPVEAELLELLKKVGIDYLVARWGDDNDLANLRDADASAQMGLKGTGHERGAAISAGWDKEVEWEHVLSLGEQQRLGLARMYYHRPKFAVLDVSWTH